MSSLFTHFFRKKRPTHYGNPSTKSIQNIINTEPNDAKSKYKSSKNDKSTPLYDPIAHDMLPKPLTVSASSVFNHPAKKTTFLQGVYGVFEDHISDHFADLLNLPDFSTASTISTDDFSGYMEKVSNSYTLFMREKENTTQDPCHLDQVDITGGLLRCYKKVPQQYFDPKFHFNFMMISNEQDGLAKFQTGLGESMKLVGDNLYYQIASKGQMILTAIKDITDEEKRVVQCIKAIEVIKTTNKYLNDANVTKIKEVLRLKRKQMNIERTIKTLEMMNLVKKIMPTLEQLIQRGNYDYAVSLLNSSEQTCALRLGPIKCLLVFQMNFQQARGALQQLLIAEFEKRCLNHFEKCLSYRKDGGDSVKNGHLAGQEQSPRALVEQRKDEKNLQVSVEQFEFNWALEDASVDNNFMDQISKIILAHIKLKEVSLTSYRLKLNELLKKFHKQITTDMTDQLSLTTSKSQDNSSGNIVFEQRVRFMVFYFRIFKQFLLRFCDINGQVLSRTVQYYEDKIPQGNQDSETSLLKILTETVQEFYSLYTVVMRNFIDKIKQVIQLVEFNNVSANQFLHFGEALDEILVFIKDKFDIQGRMCAAVSTNNQALKKVLTKITSSYVDQISTSSIASLRLIIEKQFIQTYFINKKDEITKKMKQEKWHAVEVAPENLDNFRLLYDTSLESPESLSVTRFASTSTEASEANSAKIRDHKEDESISPVMILDQKAQLKEAENGLTDHISTMICLKKKAISINGITYKVIDSYVELVQIISELYLLSLKFSSIREESALKIFQLTKLFSSTVENDVLKGNAFSGAKGGVITPEILSLAAVSLSLLDRGVEVITTKVKRVCTSTYSIVETEANQARAAVNSLAERLLGKIGEILRDVVIIDNCNKLKAVQWDSNQEKITIPTAFSSQMLTKIKAVHKKIKTCLPQQDLNTVLDYVVEDLTKYYLGVFEELEVETGVTAKRVKDELTMFMQELKKAEIFGNFELDMYEFEEKARVITEHKCDPFIELASLMEESEEETEKSGSGEL